MKYHHSVRNASCGPWSRGNTNGEGRRPARTPAPPRRGDRRGATPPPGRVAESRPPRTTAAGAIPWPDSNRPSFVPRRDPPPLRPRLGGADPEREATGASGRCAEARGVGSAAAPGRTSRPLCGDGRHTEREGNGRGQANRRQPPPGACELHEIYGIHEERGRINRHGIPAVERDLGSPIIIPNQGRVLQVPKTIGQDSFPLWNRLVYAAARPERGREGPRSGIVQGPGYGSHPI